MRVKEVIKAMYWLSTQDDYLTDVTLRVDDDIVTVHLDDPGELGSAFDLVADYPMIAFKRYFEENDIEVSDVSELTPEWIIKAWNDADEWDDLERAKSNG